MKNFTFLISCLLLGFISWQTQAQQLPLDFEANITYTFTDFDGGGATRIANPQSSGINTTANVGKMIKSAGQPWGGSFISLASPIDFSTNKVFKVKVFMPKVGAKLLLKVENETNSAINFEKEVTGTVANAWEELTFDYSTINTANQYQKLVFIFDLGTVGDGSANFTYLFDEIQLVAGGSGATAPVLPLDFESGTADYTFTNFDGGGITKITNPQSNGINTSANVGKMIKSAGQPWGGSWISLASPIDFSTKKTFKVKVFMPKVGAKLLLKVENQSNGAINFEKEVTGTVANAWEELAFDFGAINTANQYQKLVFIFDLGTVGDGSANFTYFFDDVNLVSGGGGPSLTQMNLPVTFDLSTVEYGLIGFGGAEGSTIVVDPNDANNKVAKVIKSNTAELWAGTTITAAGQLGFSSKIPFTSSDKKMNVRVWSPNAGIKVRLKVEDHTDQTKSVETESTSTVANGWEVLTFDFATQATGTAALNLAFNYAKASIFFNFGVTGAIAGEKIYYFDDVKFGAGGGGGGGTSPVLPLDFESGTLNYSFTDFDGGGATKIANPQSNGINTSANVGKMIKSAGQPWGGSFISLASPIDFSTNKAFKVKVFMPRVGAKLLLKVENETNSAINFEKEATGTVANAWEELTFDYGAINTANQYHKLVFIFDLGTIGDGSANFTYLFDDIRLIAGGGGLTAPVLPLDFESGTTDYSFTNFDGGAVTKITNPQSSSINTSANVGKMIKGTGQPWGGSFISLASPIDFSTNKTFKVKVFMPKLGAKLLLKVENQSNGAINFEKEVTGTVANAWEELTFDFGAINTANQYQKLVLIFDLNTIGDGSANFTYLFDDIKLVGGGGPVLTQMNLPVTFDLTTVEYGLAGFGGAEASTIVVDPTNATNKVAKVIKSNTAELWAGTTVTASSNLGFSSKIPFTSTEKRMNVRVWSPNAGIQVRLKVEEHGDPTKSVETEATVTVASGWETLTFDFANQANGTAAFNLAYNYDKASIFFNFGVTGATAGEKTYYFDDVRFGTFCIQPAKPTIETSGANTEEVTLTSSSSTGNQWFLNGTAISGATNATLTVTGGGIFKVQVTSGDCVSDFSDEVSFIITGDLSFPLGAVKVYPNPVEDYLLMTGLKGETSRAQLVDLMGRNSTLIFEKGNGSHRANVQHVMPGLYILQIQEGTVTHKIKVIKK